MANIYILQNECTDFSKLTIQLIVDYAPLMGELLIYQNNYFRVSICDSQGNIGIRRITVREAYNFQHPYVYYLSFKELPNICTKNF